MEKSFEDLPPPKRLKMQSSTSQSAGHVKVIDHAYLAKIIDDFFKRNEESRKAMKQRAVQLRLEKAEREKRRPLGLRRSAPSSQYFNATTSTRRPSRERHSRGPDLPIHVDTRSLSPALSDTTTGATIPLPDEIFEFRAPDHPYGRHDLYSWDDDKENEPNDDDDGDVLMASEDDEDAGHLRQTPPFMGETREIRTVRVTQHGRRHALQTLHTTDTPQRDLVNHMQHATQAIPTPVAMTTNLVQPGARVPALTADGVTGHDTPDAGTGRAITPPAERIILGRERVHRPPVWMAPMSPMPYVHHGRAALGPLSLDRQGSVMEEEHLSMAYRATYATSLLDDGQIR